MLKRNGYGQSQMDGDYYLATEVDAALAELNEIIEQMRVVYKAALAEKDRLLEAKEAEIGTWHSVFGTSQLTHAQSRLEEAEKQTQRQAEKIVRLREALQRILDYGDRTWKEEIAQAALKSEPLGDEFQKVLNTVPYESEPEAIKAFYDPKNDNMSCKEFKEKYPEKGE